MMHPDRTHCNCCMVSATVTRPANARKSATKHDLATKYSAGILECFDSNTFVPAVGCARGQSRVCIQAKNIGRNRRPKCGIPAKFPCPVYKRIPLTLGAWKLTVTDNFVSWGDQNDHYLCP